MEDFVKMCDEKFKDYPPPWDWKEMDASLEEIDSTPELSKPTLNRLVKDIILRRKAHRKDYVIKEEPSTTYDRLQSQGFIQLLTENSKDSNYSCFVFVPFIRFRQWVIALKCKPAFRILGRLVKRKAKWGYWIEFEKVTAQYFRLLIHLWSDEAKQNPPILPTREDFFTTSIRGWPNGIEPIHESPSLLTSAKQFPNFGSQIIEHKHHKAYAFDNGFVYINASGASFADVFFHIPALNGSRKVPSWHTVQVV